jgi:hypothetical protein
MSGPMTRIAAVRMFTLKTRRNFAVHTAAPIHDSARSSRSARPSPGIGRHRHRTLPEGAETSLLARWLWLDERSSNFQKLRTRLESLFCPISKQLGPNANLKTVHAPPQRLWT